MLNKRGWGIQVMMMFVMALMLALVIVAVLSNKLNKIFNAEYVSLENKVVEAATKYGESNEFKTVTIKDLIDEKYLPDLTDEYGNTCTGYVSNSLNYKAYIKCENYTTSGYMSKYDEV